MQTTTNSSQGKYVTRLNPQEIGSISWIPCNSCNNRTKHKKLWGEEEATSADEDSFDGTLGFLHEIHECMGCGSITYKKIFIEMNSEKEVDKENYEFIQDNFLYYPERQSHLLSQKFYTHMGLPQIVSEAYEETIKAYNNGLRVLCAIGIRTVIEAICISEKVNETDLKKRIDALITKGVITSRLSEGFHLSRLLGNDSAHEVKLFPNYELLTAIGLIESVLDNHYCSKTKIDLLKQSRKSDDEKVSTT